MTDDFEDCVSSFTEDFTVYDQAVDVVSAWHSYFNKQFSGHSEFPNYKFERFPTITSPDGPELTPDFTVYFNRQYVLIGEITRTFPLDEEPFHNELDQLKRYSEVNSIENASGDLIEPETIEIALIISQTDSAEIGNRLQELKDDSEMDWLDNIVLLRYQANKIDHLFRYEFQREATYRNEFSDGNILGDNSLDQQIGEGGGFQSIKSFTHHFSEFKIGFAFCNDKPPPVYLATYLWHKIFPHEVETKQYLEWQESNYQKLLEVELPEANEFTEKINDKFLRIGNVRVSWIRDTYQFLRQCDLLHEIDDGYLLRFGQVKPPQTNESVQEGQTKREKFQELANKLIRRYCKYTNEVEVENPNQQDLEF